MATACLGHPPWLRSMQLGKAGTRLLLVAQASTRPPDLTQLSVRGAQIADRPDAVDLTPSARGMDIEFRDVTFGYREDQDILQVNARRRQMPVISCERTYALIACGNAVCYSVAIRCYTLAVPAVLRNTGVCSGDWIAKWLWPHMCDSLSTSVPHRPLLRICGMLLRALGRHWQRQ